MTRKHHDRPSFANSSWVRAQLGIASLCLLTIGVGLTTGHADAPTGEELARTHFEQAVAHVDAGRLAEALEAFELSFAAEARPRTLFNIALLLSLDGRVGDALDAASSLEHVSRDAGMELDASERIQLLALRQREGANFTQVEIHFDDGRADETLRVDGTDRRWALGNPTTVWLEAGTQRIEARRNQLTIWEQSSPFSAGDILHVTERSTRSDWPHLLCRVHTVDAVVFRQARAAFEGRWGTGLRTAQGCLTTTTVIEGSLAVAVEYQGQMYPVVRVANTPDRLSLLDYGSGETEESASTSEAPLSTQLYVASFVAGRVDPLLARVDVIARSPVSIVTERPPFEVSPGAVLLGTNDQPVAVVTNTSPHIEATLRREERVEGHVSVDGWWSGRPPEYCDAGPDVVILLGEWNRLMSSLPAAPTVRERRAIGAQLVEMQERSYALRPPLPSMRHFPDIVEGVRRQLCGDHACERLCEVDSDCNGICVDGQCRSVERRVPLSLGFGIGSIASSDGFVASAEMQWQVWTFRGSHFEIGPTLGVQGYLGRWRDAMLFRATGSVGAFVSLGRSVRARAELNYALGPVRAGERWTFDWRGYTVAGGVQTPAFSVLMEYGEHGRAAGDVLREVRLKARYRFP